MLRTNVLVCLAVLALPSSGCDLLAPDAGANAPNNAVNGNGGDVEDVDGRENLGACADGLAQAEIDTNVQITADYAESLHEMVACGGLAVGLCTGVTQGIIEALLNNDGDATPRGWTYAGQGVYRTSNPGVEMTTRFYATEDFSFAAEGDPILENVFLLDNYLENSHVEINISTGRTELRFDAAGPLVELLGLGAELESPRLLTPDDLGALNNKLKLLEFDSTVVVDAEAGASTVHYLTESPRMPAQALLVGAPMAFELVEASASREELEQELSVETWTIEFVEGNRLQGASTYQLAGGLFDFVGEARFHDASRAETTVSCTR